jgi:DUF1680 family protein
MPNLARRDFLKLLALLGGPVILPSCSLSCPQPTEEEETVAYLEPVYAAGFTVQSTLWSHRVKRIIQNWIPHCYDMLSDPDLPEGGIDNFVQAARELSGETAKPHVGYWFSNAYVLNTVEAMCHALMIDPQGDADIIHAQDEMRAKLDDWLPKILSAQEPDGYLQTWTTLGNTPHWSDRAAHEGYVAGYFLEAAIAHYRMTGKTDATMYDAAKRLADCWCDNIGPAPKKTWWDGHQGMEQALTKFARFVNLVEGAGTGDKYAQLAKFLLDSRTGGGEYDQSHTLPINQTEAVGHAVRAVYMYAGMADVAMLTDSPAYYDAVNALWDNLVNKKMYVTGGVGSGETPEGFGPNYSLPNSSYCESCAGCGMLFFQYQMNLAYQDGKYADLAELALYNAILGSLDLEARNFTYTNPLDQLTARYEWHNCPCCVGNIPRTLLALPTWMYAKGGNSLYVNLFIGSTVTIDDVAGTSVQMVQTTDYPWDGNVTITVNPSTAKKFTVKIRVPDRSVSDCYTSTPDANGITSISVNGSAITPTISKGYAAITRKWRAGDRIDLVLPLSIQRVKANEQVIADQGRVALQHGPLIYNFETIDHPDISFNDLVLDPGADLSAQWDGSLLGGVVTIKSASADGPALTAIPNYVRNNRGGRSFVWIREEQLPPPPDDLVARYKFDETSGTSASDATGNGNTATLNGGVTWVAGHTGNAIDLNGVDGYVSMPAGILEQVEDFTIAAWVKLDAAATWSRIFDFGTGVEANMFLTPRSSSGNLRFAITTNGSGSEQQINSARGLETSAWKHVAVTLSGNVGILYVDGSEVARNDDMTLKPSNLGYTAANTIGKSQYAGDPYLNGQIDDFRIYNRPLSAEEISGLYFVT